MVSNDGCLKIIDFGCAKEFRKTVNTISKIDGTVHWSAPEVLNDEGVSVLVDIWSLGCTVYEMVSPIPSIYQFNSKNSYYIFR